jgi:hypothetical protein
VVDDLSVTYFTYLSVPPATRAHLEITEQNVKYVTAPRRSGHPSNLMTATNGNGDRGRTPARRARRLHAMVAE